MFAIANMNFMGSPSRLDPIPIPLRCQAGSRAQEFGFEFGFGTLSSGTARVADRGIPAPKRLRLTLCLTVLAPTGTAFTPPPG